MISEKLGKMMSRTLDMPKDVVMDLPKIVLNGDLELVCGGYKGLYEYTENEIKLSAAGKTVCIKGMGLMIKTIENEEIIVSGRIISVEFL
jgi:sporulation protein YqfC